MILCVIVLKLNTKDTKVCTKAHKGLFRQSPSTLQSLSPLGETGKGVILKKSVIISINLYLGQFTFPELFWRHFIKDQGNNGIKQIGYPHCNHWSEISFEREL